MRIRKINFDFIGPMKQELLVFADRQVVFIKPVGSKLFRVFHVPTHRADEHGDISRFDNTELKQVLTTICTRYHKGVWYFRISDEDTHFDFGEILTSMEQEHFFVEADEVALN